MIDREAGRAENERCQSGLFEAFSRELLNDGIGVRFQARGASMSPAIRDGEMVHVARAVVSELRKGDIVLTRSAEGFRLHRLVVADAGRDVYITRGDCGEQDDAAVSGHEILGIALTKEVRVGRKIVRAKFRGASGFALRGAARGQRVFEVLCSMARLTGRRMFSRSPRGASIGLGLVALLACLLIPCAHAQVAVDGTSTNAVGDLTGVANSATLNLTHTTGAGANRLLIVGVSVNIQNANTVGVVGVTYNGIPLNFVGAHNDAGKTFRVEQWYLLNPASATNAPIVVTLNIPTGVTEGVVAGATTFTGVDQTVPLGTFVSGDGAATGNSQLDVPSVINGMLLDTLAIGGNRTATVNGPQVSQWNVSTAGGTANPDVTGVGSARTGAPSVPISEAFSGNSNWSLGAISVNPSTADIAVTTSVSAVPLGQHSTYNIKIVNNGPSAANAVVLTDTYATAGLSVVSVTPSAGTTCTTAATITCTLPASFASGATATVAVVVATTAAGFYPNTAVVSDSGTPTDPNTGNNTYVALAPVVSVICSPNSLGAGGTLNGTVNTYYPGTATVAAGATSIPVGTATGAAGTIVNGSLLLVIQMQDASINDSQGVAYGNGSTGSGFTAINNSGNYEYVTATGPVSGGFVPISGAGTGGGLVFGYTSAIATSSKGQSTYQVVLVPQYTSATLGALTTLAWNGSTGGVFALSIAGQLNLGGGSVSANAAGFRGGAGMQLTGGVAGATNQDYWQTPPAAYTGAAGGVAGIDGSKGEGVAGTPEWVESGVTFLKTTTAGAPIGYPNGTAADGSMARGAPGNAGGGGTDGDAGGNTENAGGGGGGNGGTGGSGGDSWNTNFSDGGYGGTSFPATIDRIAMGGGGGAGSRNNSDGDNQASGGATGGGIIFIRADSFTGTATLTANGGAGYLKTSNDAGGGGGAGGTIVALAVNGGESGLTLQATGGRGGDAWDTQPYSLADRHGPGGGGAGGVVFVSGAAAGISVTGGGNGTTLTPGVAYGATPGSAGTSATTATQGQVTGIQFETLCPDLTLGKSHVGNFTRGSAASYTIPVSNASTLTATSGLVTLNDTLPYGLTPTGASGTGWACTVSGQTISCTRSDSLAAASAYPSITLSAAVSQAAPATVTNTAVVGGGGEANLLNDSATDVANVVSVADLSVTDSGAPNPVAAGSNISYTQVVTNNGPSAADNATYVAAIPANTTYYSIVAPPGWNCLAPGGGGTGNVVCNNVSMPGLTTATFTLTVAVNAGTANGTVIADTVSAGSSVSDPNTLNNTATANTVVGTTALGELTVSNVASPNPVQAGNDITYTQVVTNTGTLAATGATFTESTPPGHATFVSITPPAGWSCVGFPGTPCSNPNVAPGSSGTFTVIYLVTAGTANGTAITDTATVNATNQAFGANSATANDVVGGAAQADMALATATSPEAVLSGNNITYTQTVTNNGPAAATGASFTEATPTNTTFQSVLAPAGWTCTSPAVGATGTVNCTNPTLAAGATANIIVVVNVPPSVVAASITATSSVTATPTDPTAANNTTTTVTPVGTVCDLAVTDVGTPNPVATGGTITYTQVITNSGPSSCSTATFTEPLPGSTTFTSEAVVNAGGVTWTCSGTAPLTCTAPTVPPGSTGTLTVKYASTGAAGTQVTDTVTVGTTTKDSLATNNTATFVTGVSSGGQADLTVTNSASPNPVTAGNIITYTQSVINNGRATAAAPTFTEAVSISAGTVVPQTLVGPGGTWTCTLATLTCTDSAGMTSGSTANFTFTVLVSNTDASGSTVTETDKATSTTTDSNPTNNSLTVTTQVGDSAALSVTNVSSPVPVAAGSNITYTQVVTNGGPSAATTATITETTPPNTTFQSVTTPAGWSCVTPAVNATGTITCSNPSFAPGTGSFSVVLGVNAGTAAGTAINDTVSVNSAVTDPNLANNSATATDVVATAGQADLVTTNLASASSVAPGSNITYTQSVTNNGPAVAAAGLTFTETTPPNTTFVSITPPATGWTCVEPAVGGTGTITCTASGTLGIGAVNTANFSLVLQVNSLTPTGTNITDTVTASASNIPPGLTTNTASASVLVANANSADVSIVKTGNPNPVTEGTPLTYTLTVTNGGPASATNVTVTDTLPSVLSYLSSATTQGSCSEAGGTVSCLLGTMANAATATITILTFPGTPGVVTNTATVTADQADPNLANNSSTQTETIAAPTKVTMRSFSARQGSDKNGASRVMLMWKTGGEAHNLGFNVYRELNGNRVRMNSSMIAGSALLMSGALPKHAGRSYAWIDPSAGATGASYWLEDIDLNGTRTMYGPIPVQAGVQSNADTTAAETRMFSQLSQAQPPAAGTQESHFVEALPVQLTPTASQIQKQFDLAAHPAVKILVRQEGWYRVAQSDLVKAGLDANVDPAHLHLFAEAVEQPIQITGATPGAGGFGPQAAINFYGTGIDTEFSGTRVYWLVASDSSGARISTLQASSGSNQPPASYPATVVLQPHSIYFAALTTSNGQNFFGSIVSPTTVEEVLTVPHLDAKSAQPARLEVVLQGVIVAFPHDVKVTLNGTSIGDVTFTGQKKGTLSLTLPSGLLLEGNNTIGLTAQNGDYDTSLVDTISITYPHAYVADSDTLKFTGRAGDELNLSGFTSAPTVLDITDPARPVQVTPHVTSNSGNYQLALQVPWTTTNPAAPARHTLLAVASDRIAAAAGVRPNHPSHWHSAQAGADIAMVTHEEFADALTPLVQAHQAEGKSSVVVPVVDLYDEFNFGERTPLAIRQFLQSANTNWKNPPAYLLLNGRASYDPRNYLGMGHLDLVPTRVAPSSGLMTSSDDWFSDFTDSGMPTIATGRLPVSTVDEANTVVGKIVAYEGKSTNGAWTSQALMVTDKDDTESFTQDNQTVQAQMPQKMQVTDVFTGTVGTTAAQQDIINGINSGQLLVNYLGHGSEEQWSGSDIFDTNSVPSLTNSSQLPVFLIMDCLNGFFQDVYAQPLGVTLLLAPNGGAVAVLASSGLNQPTPQTQLDKLVVQNVMNAARPTLGQSILKAKSKISDASVRRTFILFGDPAMQLKQPSTAAAAH